MKTSNFLATIRRFLYKRQHSLVGTWHEIDLTTYSVAIDNQSVISPDLNAFSLRYIFRPDGTCIWEYMAEGEMHTLITHWRLCCHRLSVRGDRTYRLQWQSSDEIVLLATSDDETYTLRLHRYRNSI